MPHEFKVPASEIDARIGAVQKRLRDTNLDGLFIVQRIDLFYFSGTAQHAFLFIPAHGDPLLLVKRYLPRALRETSIRRVTEIGSVQEVPGLVRNACGSAPRTIGFELDVVPARNFEFYRRLFAPARCVDASSIIHQVRMIKSEWEIAQIEHTAGLSRDTFDYIRATIRPGYTEMEFASMYEAFARTRGHGGQMRVRDYLTEGYPWHLLSGTSGGMVGVLDSPASGEGTSPAFPCGAGYRKMEADEPIMIDFNSVLNGYHFDETRMFALGSMPPKAHAACRAAIDIHDAVLDRVGPGMAVSELFDLSVKQAAALGFSRSYLGPPGYKVSFIGHGIGLELIEPPIIASGREDVLMPGMVLALEPKLVFEHEFAAGIESVFAVTDRGHRLLSRVPVQVFIC